jgi:hypothetical protein
MWDLGNVTVGQEQIVANLYQHHLTKTLKWFPILLNTVSLLYTVSSMIFYCYIKQNMSNSMGLHPCGQTRE